MHIVIQGSGVAAFCCAHLLKRGGMRVVLRPAERPRLPVIMLGERTLELIRDVFDRPDLFAGATPIRKRIVAWGADPRPAVLEHAGVTVSEDDLLNGIRAELNEDCGSLDGPDWTIVTANPLPTPSVQHCFGSRIASVSRATLRSDSDSACWIEAMQTGWLFLIENAPRSAWLLSIGGSPRALLDGSRVVAPRITGIGEPMGEFPAFPRIGSPLGGKAWLACGGAATAFDPICGDGTAYAIREAILAAAVIRAMARGTGPGDLLSHYEARLTAAFARHLTLCRQFYQSGGTGPFWASELEAIDKGIGWCNARTAAVGAFRFRLRGFDLEAVP